jgi:hypothetical protein
MRFGVTRGVVVLLLAWGCGGSSNYFEEEPEGGSGQGGSGQSGAGQGGAGGGAGAGGASGGAGGVGGAGGAGGASGGAGGVGGAGGAQGGAGAIGGTGSGRGGAAGSPVGGSAGRAGAGQGGGDGGAMACSDPDGTGARGDGSTAKSTTTGVNGSFTDSCDESGNLVEHFCEIGPCVSARVAFPAGFGGTGGFENCPTGKVVSRTIDCGGHCEDATCFDWCAEQGGSFEITGVSETTVLMTKGAYEYTCEVIFEGDGFDCRDPSLAGRTLVVTSLGTCDGESTTFGWNDPESALAQECTFTCTFE